MGTIKRTALPSLLFGAARNGLAECATRLLVLLWLFALQANAAASDTSAVVKGSMGGIQMEIPRQDMFLAMEFVGESIWNASEKKEGRTSPNSEISNFSMQLEWPSLNSRPRKSMEFADNDKGWIVISVILRSRGSPGQYFPIESAGLRNGWSRLLSARLEGRQESLPKGVVYVPVNDKRFGLFVAEPEGPGAERAALWNDTLLWDGMVGSQVETYIECRRGQYPNPRTVHRCVMHYTLPEIQSDVKVEFASVFLPDWKAIKARTAARIASFERR